MMRSLAWIYVLLILYIGSAGEVNSAGLSPLLSAKAAFRDCPDCSEMVKIPAGAFTMGSPENEPGRTAKEGPQHPVSVPAFALAKYEVTRGEYAVFVRETKRDTSGGCNIFTGREDSPWEADPAASWQHPGFAQTERDPVVCVSWDDATAYAAWMSRKTGKTYRLPTEAEWEYAARAGAQGPFFWGDNPDDSCLYANAVDLTYHQKWPRQKAVQCNDGFLYTAPVGSFRPNAFGLYDMQGNAYEFVQDCYEPEYVAQPHDGSAYTGGECTKRVYRGGSWHNSVTAGHDIRLANRVGAAPGERNHNHGFRLARQL